MLKSGVKASDPSLNCVDCNRQTTATLLFRFLAFNALEKHCLFSTLNKCGEVEQHLRFGVDKFGAMLLILF